MSDPSPQLSEKERAWQTYLALLKQERFAPANAEVKVNLALVLKVLGDREPAEAKARDAVRLAPDSSRANQVLGFMEQERGAYEDALAHLRQARTLDPAIHDPYHLLGLTFLALRRHGEFYAVPTSPHAGQQFSEETIRAIMTWLDGDFSECERRLALAHAARSSAPPKTLISGVFETYWNYLNSLIRERRARDADPPPDHPPVYFIGDSHCLSPAHSLVTVDGEPRRVVADLVFACKAWDLVGPGPNPRAAAFAATIARIPPQSTAMICIGELDCRYGSGIYRYAGREGLDALDVARQLATDYVERVVTAVAPLSLRLHLATPPVSNMNEKLLPPATVLKLRQIADTFAETVRQQAAARNINIVDLNVATRDADGTPRRSFFVDTNHVLPVAFMQALTIGSQQSGLAAIF
jgi:hypothetical protein